MKFLLKNSIGKKIYTITGIAIICFSIQFFVSVMFIRSSDRLSALIKIDYEHTEVRRNIAESFYRYLSSGEDKDFTELFNNLLVSIEQMSVITRLPGDLNKESADNLAADLTHYYYTIRLKEAEQVVWAIDLLSSKTIRNRMMEINKACEQMNERCFSLSVKRVENLDKANLDILKSDLRNFIEDSERLAGELSSIIETISQRGESFITGGMIIIFIFLLAISTSLAWLLTRSITNPLRTLVDFAGAIAGGDLSRKLEIKQKDEIGVLSRAMNEMRKNLAEDIERRQQVEEELKSFLEFNETILSSHVTMILMNRK